jgi:[ribosomal protein S5]-alanine N-acetyltransferase
MPLVAPEFIQSQRLYIRRVHELDLPALFLVNGNDEVTRFLPYSTWVTPNDALAWLEKMRAQEAAGTALQFVLIERATHVPVGAIVLHRYHEESQRAELGYVLGRPWWGRGYMREGLTALCDSAFTDMGLRRIEAEVETGNGPSIRLLLSLGFAQEGVLRERWTAKGRTYDVNIYGVLARDWSGPVMFAR